MIRTRLHRAPRPSRARTARRPGTTTLELCVALAVVALTSAVVLPRVGRALDGIAVQSATAAIASACAVARSAAILRGAIATVAVDEGERRVTVTVGDDTVLAHALDTRPFRLTLTASRDVIAYDPIGLGFGAANTTVIARQGAAADTLYTSRLGRVRR
jgi:Tfp pilus assembly protein FimT